jgi:carbon monoxide dehydrogenase subunit G
MFELSQSLEIDRPAAQVWPYLIAFEQVPLWEHGVVEVRQVTPGPPDIGTEVLARRIYGGRESRLTGRIVAFEEGRTATMALRGGPLGEVYVEYAVEPIGDRRSVVTYRARGNLIRPLRFLHPILPALGRAESRKNLAKLKRRIEAGIEPGSTATLPPPDR